MDILLVLSELCIQLFKGFLMFIGFVFSISAIAYIVNITINSKKEE